MKNKYIIILVVAAVVSFVPQSKADLTVKSTDNGAKANVSREVSTVATPLAVEPGSGLNRGGIINVTPPPVPLDPPGDPLPDGLESGALVAGVSLLWFGGRQLGMRVVRRNQSA